MKSMNLTFNDEEFKRIEKLKIKAGAKSWEKFIIMLCSPFFKYRGLKK